MKSTENTNSSFLTKPVFNSNITPQKIIFVAVLALCFFPFISPPIALLLGLLIAQFVGHPFLSSNNKIVQLLLKFSVVGLGFGMNANSALKAGKEGFVFTIFSIILTFVLGYFVSKLLKIEKKTSFLISGGTAICGGSAIAAIAPAIKAEEKQISVALGTIFILNSIALFVFPFVGHLVNLDASQFGLWCAIAIHDTSSVVGAAAKFGPEALEVATTVKLARALWIIPISLLSIVLFKSKESKVKIPYFIGLFVLAMLANSYIPMFIQCSSYISTISKIGLTITLFLIGTGLSMKVISSVGIKPLLLGIILWICISATSLWVILSMY